MNRKNPSKLGGFFLRLQTFRFRAIIKIMKWYQKNIPPVFLVGFVLIIFIITAASLFLMGRLPICECDNVLFWYNNTNGPGNSQHITDWYSFTHVVHGFLYYLVIWLVLRKKNISFGLKLLIAVSIAAGWEILENSTFIIERYRTATFALDYYGDTIINSLSDVVMAIGGFLIASKIRPWISVALVITFELMLLYYVRDNLSLNIIMLLVPIEAIKNWQAAL